ncbi:MAG: LacI family DNA-binding transcriptional regulator [Bauldia sp.]
MSARIVRPAPERLGARLPPDAGRKRKTIRDVAALAGVDASLVSRVLNDHPKASASPATRERIRDAARTLGYQPNVVARGLRMARTWTLGLLLPNLSNPMYADIARAAERRALDRGFGLIFGTNVDGEEEATFARLLQQGRVDGLLAASGALGDGSLRRVADAGHGPVVMLNRRVRGVRPSVTLDDAAGAALATAHLAGLGHRHVAGIFGVGTIDTIRRRRAGFLAAGKEAGIATTVIEAAGLDAAAGREAAVGFFRARSEATAIFASTFAIGVGALRAAREEGVRIPDDLSLIALHDSELADYLSPPMTTVGLPVGEMAHRAVDLLIDLIEGARPYSVVVDSAPVLKERGSTAPPKVSG